MSFISKILKDATIGGASGVILGGSLAVTLVKAKSNIENDEVMQGMVCTIGVIAGGGIGVVSGTLYGVYDYFTEQLSF